MALLQPDTARIGHPPGQPAEDRFPEELVSGTPREIREALSKLVGADQVLYRAIDLVRYASDASPYRLIPQVVVVPRTVDDVVALLKYCRENKFQFPAKPWPSNSGAGRNAVAERARA